MHKLRNVMKNAVLLFILQGIFFIPASFHLLSCQLAVTDWLFGSSIRWIALNIFSHELVDTEVYSDSVSMYVLLFILGWLAMVAALLLQSITFFRTHQNRIYSFCHQIFAFYLSVLLLKYGAGKIFKDQFYLPEPNTLYTTLGNIDKDLLFWSTMGSSYSYNIITGIVECTAALMLWFPVTRFAGALVATMLMLHVTSINFSFDISVKLYSLFLLLICFYLIAPNLINLYRFLFKGNTVQLLNNRTIPGIRPAIATSLRIFVMGLFLIETMYPALQNNNFNDDRAPRPFLHGAYEVEAVLKHGDTIRSNNATVKRFYIHRNGYIIFENDKGQMIDYKLWINPLGEQMVLQDYDLKKTTISFDFDVGKQLLSLHYPGEMNGYTLIGKVLQWQTLSLLKSGFNWTIDAP